MSNGGYNIAAKKQMDGDFNGASLDLRLLLVKSGYVYNPDHQFVSDLTPGSNELSGTGYSRKTLTGKATSQDNTNDRAELDCDDVTFTGINAGTAIAAVVFVQVTNDSDSWLVGYYDEGGFPFATNGGNLTLQVNSEGLVQVQV